MPQTIASIKARLSDKKGQSIAVTQQTGRRRITTRHGVLSEIYPAVFVVELDQHENKFERVCFSYTDVLTDNVEIEFPQASDEA